VPNVRLRVPASTQHLARGTRADRGRARRSRGGRPLLVQQPVHALRRNRLAPGVRRPAPARWHWRGRRQLIGRTGRQPALQLGALLAGARPAPPQGSGPPPDPGPAPSWSGTNSDARPIAGERLGRPRQQRRNTSRARTPDGAESPPPTTRRRHAGSPAPRASLEPPERRSPSPPAAAGRLPQVGRIGRADQQPHWMPAVKLGLHVRRHLDSVDHQVPDQPSITASCITTPIRRARVKSHSRNSASVRSVLKSRHAWQYPPEY